MDQWRVFIRQNGVEHSTETGALTIDKEPFTICIQLPKGMYVLVNVMDDDSNFRLIRPGLPFQDEELEYPEHCFTAGYGGAENWRNPDQHIWLSPDSHHNWVHISRDESHFDRASMTSEGLLLERDVNSVYDTCTDISTSVFSMPHDKLFMLFVVPGGQGNRIVAEGLLKLVLSFGSA